MPQRLHAVPSASESSRSRPFRIPASGKAERGIGSNKVATCPLIPGSEDFSYFLAKKPDSFLRLGNGMNSAVLHSPKHDFADENLTVGAALWARLVERFLQK